LDSDAHAKQRQSELSTIAKLLSRRGFLYLPSLALLLPTNILAQSCPHTWKDHAQWSDLVEHAEAASEVFRSAAIAGEEIISALKRLSKPDFGVDTIPGASQVSLAKLGDRAALDELEYELNHSQYGGYAIQKLLRVDSDRAIQVLITYLQANLADASLARTYGDYTVDPRSTIVQGLGRVIPSPPTDSSGGTILSFDGWLDWWRQNRNNPVALSISGKLRDPYLRCLARKIEWGFPDAILDMANVQDIQLLPFLKTLVHVGEQASILNTIRGRAEFALAKLGDEAEFRKIVSGLDHSGYRSCIAELQLIWGP